MKLSAPQFAVPCDGSAKKFALSHFLKRKIPHDVWFGQGNRHDIVEEGKIMCQSCHDKVVTTELKHGHLDTSGINVTHHNHYIGSDRQKICRLCNEPEGKCLIINDQETDRQKKIRCGELLSRTEYFFGPSEDLISLLQLHNYDFENESCALSIIVCHKGLVLELLSKGFDSIHDKFLIDTIVMLRKKDRKLCLEMARKYMYSCGKDKFTLLHRLAERKGSQNKPIIPTPGEQFLEFFYLSDPLTEKGYIVTDYCSRFDDVVMEKMCCYTLLIRGPIITPKPSFFLKLINDFFDCGRDLFQFWTLKRRCFHVVLKHKMRLDEKFFPPIFVKNCYKLT